MIVNGHLFIARILYGYCKRDLNFELNKRAFLLGNIKPDFYSNEIRAEHDYSNSINGFIKFSGELLKNKKSNKEFSIGLGVLCHFICDYFCLYHQKEYKKRNIIEHTLYEIALYFVLVARYFRQKITIKSSYEILSKSIPSGILYNINKYLKEKRSFDRDIDYALSTSAFILKYIILNSQVLEYEDEDIFELQSVSGGII